MAKKQKFGRYEPIQLVVSIPRAGEFIATIQLDPSNWALRTDPTVGDISSLASDCASDKIKIKPLKGEASRVLKRLKERNRG